MKTSRTHEDLCLLCRKNKASKIESHIYPKFFTQSMFGDKHNKKGNSIGTQAIEKIKQDIDAGKGVDTSKAFKPATDTAKEKYLLCEDCERIRLGSLDTYIFEHFYRRYKNPYFTADFVTVPRRTINPGEFDLLVCKSLNVGMFKPFIYSLVWRAAISSLPGYRYFKLSDHTEEVLRQTLDRYLHEKAEQTVDYINANVPSFPQLQYTIFTSLELPSSIKNLTSNPHDFENGEIMLFINDFIIRFNTRWNEITRYNSTFNSGEYLTTLVLVKEDEWQNLINSFTHGVINSIFVPPPSDEIVGYFWMGDSPVEYRTGFKKPRAAVSA
jgi:hypothetical protein